MKFINCAQPHCKSIKTRFIFHILTLQHKHAKPQVQRIGKPESLPRGATDKPRHAST